MTHAVLRITDGVSYINLLSLKDGFMLRDWTPTIPELKGGGLTTGSPFSDGSILILGTLDDTYESFDIVVSGPNMDDVIGHLQDLRRMLQKARNYWIANWHGQPVWIEARGSTETNTRYAIVKDWLLQTDDNPYAQPMYSSCSKSIANDLTLTIRRGHWQNIQPGSGVCVEASATRNYNVAGSGTFAPAASAQDAYVNWNSVTISLNGTVLYFGGEDFRYWAGIYFPSVNIPRGAKILTAYLQFVSATSLSEKITAYIYGQSSATPSVFSTFIDFANRPRTSQYVVWNPNAWYAGTTYVSPSITTIVQQIVDLSTWASGNNMVLFIQQKNPLFPTDPPVTSGLRGPASYDNVTYTEPKLILEWDLSETTYGREATCLPEVYVANKHNMAQITHIFNYDDSEVVKYSANLLNNYPYDLYPAVPAANDAVMFGISKAVDDSGPFSSLIFDITTAASGITGDLWEYSTGAGAWTTLAVTDNTNDGSGEAFTVVGVNGVHWVQPADWTAEDYNGVTAYWVRSVISSVSSPTPATQGNRDVYTVVIPYVDIAEDQVPGDITALARAVIHNNSFTADYMVKSLWMALRSNRRGENFVSHINISDEQNPADITVTVAGAPTTFIDSTEAATGRVASWNPAGDETMANRVYITIAQPLIQEYVGTFQLFLRAQQIGGVAGDMSVRVRAAMGSGGEFFTSETLFTTINDDGYELFHLGIVRIPPTVDTFRVSELSTLYLFIDAANTNDTVPGDLYIHDLILMPADEWIGNFSIINETSTDTSALLGNSRILDISSLTNPRRELIANLHQDTNLREVLEPWKYISPGGFILQNNAAQRLYFLEESLTINYDPFCPHEISMFVELEAAARYFSMRGSR